MISEYLISMLDFQEYHSYDKDERKTFQLKWIFLFLLAIRIPWSFLSLLEILNFIFQLFSLCFGVSGVRTLKKLHLVLYCCLSEICFFLSTYDICDLLENGHKYGISKKIRVFFVALYVIWSLIMFYSIKLMLDLFKTTEYKPLFNFRASTERYDESNEMIESSSFSNHGSNNNSGQDNISDSNSNNSQNTNINDTDENNNNVEQVV